MHETRLRLQLVLGAARMSIWDATVADGDINDGVVTWLPDGAALVGLVAVQQDQGFPDFPWSIRKTAASWSTACSGASTSARPTSSNTA